MVVAERKFLCERCLDLLMLAGPKPSGCDSESMFLTCFFSYLNMSRSEGDKAIDANCVSELTLSWRKSAYNAFKNIISNLVIQIEV